MPTTKHECTRAIEGIEESKPLIGSGAHDHRRDHEKHAEERKCGDAASPADREAQMPGKRRTLFTTEHKAGRGAKRDRRDLSKRPAERRDNRDRGKRDSGPYTIRDKAF